MIQFLLSRFKPVVGNEHDGSILSKYVQKANNSHIFLHTQKCIYTCTYEKNPTTSKQMRFKTKGLKALKGMDPLLYLSIFTIQYHQYDYTLAQQGGSAGVHEIYKLGRPSSANHYYITIYLVSLIYAQHFKEINHFHHMTNIKCMYHILIK